MKIRILAMTIVLCSSWLTAGAIAAQRPAPLTGAFNPEEVLEELHKTIQDRDWKRYADFLSAEFRFTPFDGVIQEYPAIKWGEWDRVREIGFIRELVDPNHAASLRFDDKILDKSPESHGRVEWDLVYTLTTRGQEFKSRAVFVFEEIDNLWFLREWIDTTVESEKETGGEFPTSGTLRGVLNR